MSYTRPRFSSAITTVNSTVTSLLVSVMVSGLLSVASCTHANTSVAPGGSPMVVTEDQIDKLHAANAYDIVVQTHGNFLRSRGRESDDPRTPAIPVHVFVDDTYYGDVSTLRGITAGDVAEIRFYQSYEAQYKFGSGHMGGVIQVITKM